MSWEIEYKKKLRTPEEALRCVQSGMRMYIHPGCAEPEVLVKALIACGPAVEDVEIVHLMTMGDAGYIAPELESHFRHNAIFIGGNVRKAVNEGRRSEEHTSELQSRGHIVCRLLLETK